MLIEWRKEVDKRFELYNKNDEVYKAKINILRAKVMAGEEEMNKMKATIASLSKEVAKNVAVIAEYGERNSEVVSAKKPQPSGATNMPVSKQTASNRGPSSASSYRGGNSGPPKSNQTNRNGPANGPAGAGSSH